MPLLRRRPILVPRVEGNLRECFNYPYDMFCGNKLSLKHALTDDMAKAKVGDTGGNSAVIKFPINLQQPLYDCALEIGWANLADGPWPYEISFRAGFSQPPLMVKHTWGGVWWEFPVANTFLKLLTLGLIQTVQIPSMYIPLFGFITEVHADHFVHQHNLGDWRLVTYTAFGLI